MKRILASILTIGLSGCAVYPAAPAYVAPAPVYYQPAPIYYGPPVYFSYHRYYRHW